MSFWFSFCLYFSLFFSLSLAMSTTVPFQWKQDPVRAKIYLPRISQNGAVVGGDSWSVVATMKGNKADSGYPEYLKFPSYSYEGPKWKNGEPIPITGSDITLPAGAELIWDRETSHLPVMTTETAVPLVLDEAAKSAFPFKAMPSKQLDRIFNVVGRTSKLSDEL